MSMYLNGKDYFFVNIAENNVGIHTFELSMMLGFWKEIYRLMAIDFS